MRPSREDTSRWLDAVHVRHGTGGSGAVRQTWYVLYVVALLGATYGVAVTRGVLLEFEDFTVLADFDPALALLSLVLGLLAVSILARRLGAIRGPVVPELVWIELVVASSLDRALVLREPWRVALIMCIGCTSIIGITVGFSAWVVGLGAWPVVVGSLAGPLLGWWLAVLWLWGQAAAGGSRGRRTFGSRALRRAMGIDVLRRQSALSRLVHGSVLIGDLRGTRLGVSAPGSRGRTLRLRPGSPIATVVRRDVLGYRRSPATVVTGTALLALGTSGLVVAATQPEAPLLLGLMAAATAYLGCGCWCGGLRMQVDNASAPTLLGMTPRRQAVTHLIAPLGLTLVVGLSSATLLLIMLLSTTSSPDAATVATTVGVVFSVLSMCLATQLWAATRSIAYLQLVTLSVGPILVASWYAVPLLSVAAAGGWITVQVTGGQTWWWMLIGLFATAAALLLGRVGIDRETDAQRE